MSNPKNPSGGLLPEPPELGAERERLLPELDKAAKSTSGTTQVVLRKLNEVLVHMRPGVPVDFQLYADAKVAIERFAKDPVLPVPPVLMQTIEFMQKRAVAMGYTGKMQLPKGAPPPPPGMVSSVAGSASASAGAASAGGAKGSRTMTGEIKVGGAPSGGAKAGGAPSGGAKAGGAKAGGAKDGFEGRPRTMSSVDLNPVSGQPVAAKQGKADSQTDASTSKLKNLGVGNLKG
ncbi:hypothetical protein [Hyalangium sp.]|uniref:hypothetical protein n=1 Tax=Hyalangium sp. TaxID=2028555 RepID=UPI002D40A3A2|nr:hypothetical protein [Hyalangium sp.]HYH99192.1 hypothetical protein [Hyalangium sp.]